MADNQAVVTPTGNSFLDGLSRVTEIAGGVLNQVGGFINAGEVAKASQQQQTSQPQIVVSNPTSGSDFLSNPEKLQKVFLVVGSVTALGLVTYVALKR